MLTERFILGFFGLAIGIISGIFAYLLRRVTKGATKGWLFLYLEGLALFLWGLFFSVSVILDSVTGKILVTGILVPFICFFGLLGYVSFLSDFGIKKYGWINARNCAIFSFVLYVFVAAFNYFFSSSDWPVYGLGTVGIFVGGFLALLASIAAFILFYGTGRYIWFSQFLYVIMVFLGLWSISYVSLCCWDEGPLSEDEVCIPVDYEYQEIFSMPCFSPIIPVADFFYNMIAAGLLIFGGSLGVFWWRLR